MRASYYVQSTVLDAENTVLDAVLDAVQKRTEISDFRGLHFSEKKTTINKSNIEYMK